MARLNGILTKLQGSVGSFGGARNGRSDYNKFVSANLGKAPVYLTKQEAQAGASIVAPYEVTHGSIKSIKINGKGNQAVTDISLGNLAITDETTVKEFC